MEKFRAIMAGATERHVDNALKIGATLAEVCDHSLYWSLANMYSLTRCQSLHLGWQSPYLMSVLHHLDILDRYLDFASPGLQGATET